MYDLLSAVNTMLSDIGTRQVDSLVNNKQPHVKAALGCLQDATVSLLTNGWWFNRDKSVEYQPGDDKRIRVPKNMLSMDFKNRDIVSRGGFLWDRDNNTQYFSAPVMCDQTVMLDWDDIPVIAKRCILIDARAQFILQILEDSVKASTFLQQHAEQAMADLSGEDIRREDYSIWDRLPRNVKKDTSWHT